MSEIVTIGNATLHHADCRDVLPTLGQIDALVSDPPYGIDFKHSGSATRPVGMRAFVRSNAERIGGDDVAFDWATWAIYTKNVLLFGANHWHAQPTFGSLLCWDKSIGIGPKDSFTDGEFMWTSQKTQRNVYRQLWKGICSSGEMRRNFVRVHVSQKPVELMRWCIELFRDEPRTVFDPFMGSGSTGVACVQLGRAFVGIEFERKYFDIACERISRAHAQGQLFPAVVAKPEQMEIA